MKTKNVQYFSSNNFHLKNFSIWCIDEEKNKLERKGISLIVNFQNAQFQFFRAILGKADASNEFFIIIENVQHPMSNKF